MTTRNLILGIFLLVCIINVKAMDSPKVKKTHSIKKRKTKSTLNRKWRGRHGQREKESKVFKKFMMATHTQYICPQREDKRLVTI